MQDDRLQGVRAPHGLGVATLLGQREQRVHPGLEPRMRKLAAAGEHALRTLADLIERLLA